MYREICPMWLFQFFPTLQTFCLAHSLGKEYGVGDTGNSGIGPCNNNKKYFALKLHEPSEFTFET